MTPSAKLYFGNTELLLQIHSDRIAKLSFVFYSTYMDQTGLTQKLVIVEDNAALADIYKIRLELDGYTCFVAYDGQSALAMIEKELPNLVLLDLMVPKIAGDEILARMRASTWGKNIKVLIISNLNEADAPAGLRNLGIEDYAVKANLSNDQLDRLVDNILKPADQEEDVVLETKEP
jgi:DNA-binding response OmpR family regulator